MDVVKMVSETFETDDSTAIGILTAVVVVVLSLLLYVFVFRRGGKAKNSLLFLGLTDSGKTVMFNKFVAGTAVTTFTSIMENVFPDFKFANAKSTFDLVDVPGSDKIRKRMVDHRLRMKEGRVRGIVFVVDSATFTKTAKDVAEFLYDVLCDAPRKLPVLIACNKQDLPLAKSAEVVRKQLEKEFSLLNRSRAAALDSTDGHHDGRLLSEGEFHWEDLSQKLSFRECSSKSEEEGGLNEVEAWAATI